MGDKGLAIGVGREGEGKVGCDVVTQEKSCRDDTPMRALLRSEGCEGP